MEALREGISGRPSPPPLKQASRQVTHLPSPQTLPGLSASEVMKHLWKWVDDVVLIAGVETAIQVQLRTI